MFTKEDIKNLLEQIGLLEKKMGTMYSLLYSAIDNESYKEVFKNLAADEQSHGYLIDKIISLLQEYND